MASRGLRALPLLALSALACGCKEETEESPRIAGVSGTTPRARTARPDRKSRRPRVEGRNADSERGRRLFRNKCAVCHGESLAGDGMNSHYLPGVRMRDLAHPTWFAGLGAARVAEIVRRGSAAMPERTKGPPMMPGYGKTLDTGQIDDIVAFLRVAGRMRFPRLANLSGNRDAGCGTCHNTGGMELARQTNCAGCHDIPGLERREIAPPLDDVGLRLRKEWIHGFLLEPFNSRAPGYIPLEKTRMPVFSLSRSERVALTEFLSTRTRGAHRRYRPPEGLDPRQIREQGRVRFDALGCIACHKLGKEGGKVGPDLTDAGNRLRPDWVYSWIADPRAHHPDTPMPALVDSDDDARLLAAFVLSNRQAEPTRPDPHLPGTRRAGGGDGPPAPPAGKRAAADRYPRLDASSAALRRAEGAGIFRRLGCNACHALAGFEFDAAKKVGPSLAMAGLRLDPDWFFDFLRAPQGKRIRPDLGAHMPKLNLTKGESMSLVAAFRKLALDRYAAVMKEAPRRRRPWSPAAAERGRKLFVAKDCHSCHAVGGRQFPPVVNPYYPPKENQARKRWAPDLAHARRLQYPWAHRWIVAPEAFGPDPLMPSAGLTHDEAEAILHWLLGELRKR